MNLIERLNLRFESEIFNFFESRKTGRSYDGEWADGFRHGKGIETYQGKTREVEYIKGKEVGGTPRSEMTGQTDSQEGRSIDPATR